MTSRPRREWKSLRCVARWSVRLRMRSLRIAICTSGEPVSPSLRAYSLTSSCLRASVIDIGSLLISKIQHAHRPESSRRNLGERHQLAAGGGANHCAVAELIDARLIGGAQQRHGLTATQAEGFDFRQGQSRDVVQRGLDRKKMLGSGGTMPQGGQFIQGNRAFQAETPDGKPAQRDDMGTGAKHLAQIAG